ncbi:MAG: type I pullulanase [Tissierellia bacterium]|nr:type I pullulanase [Tissierellia bacterium]
MNIFNQSSRPTSRQLGVIYRKNSTVFRVWAPTRKKVELLLYDEYNEVRRRSYPMYRKLDGVYQAEISGDLNGVFYTYRLDETYEVTDPYSKAASINSLKSVVMDMENTDPAGFRDYEKPKNNRKDAIIYEVHIKDFTVDMTSGVHHRGRYLGFVDVKGKFKNLSTGIEHLKELGVTHVHLLPVADFITVREEPANFFKSDNYNWGYDPELYNVPEGSYATDPYDPENRIIELKTLIMHLHQAGMNVVVDVVYNHTYRTFDSNFNTLVPNYYYRRFDDGTFSNGSGTGNEIASEKPMARSFIIESLLYWQREYRLDGFRFDLMALIDKETIYQAIKVLRKEDPNCLIYGEPWVAQNSPLPEAERCGFGAQRGKGFAFFNPYFRDALKGDGNSMQNGFVQGEKKTKNAVETGMLGSIHFDNHHSGFCKEPEESINYFNSHDDLIVMDKFKQWFGDIPELASMSKLVMSMLLTSQGIPFFHAGNEFARDKKLVKNTYNSDLTINGIDWALKSKYYDVFTYTRDIIWLRKNYPHFKLMNRFQIKERIKILSTLPEYMVGISILVENEMLLVIHNAGWAVTEQDMDKLLESVEKAYDIQLGKKVKMIFGGSGNCNRRMNRRGSFYLDRIATTILSVQKDADDA